MADISLRASLVEGIIGPLFHGCLVGIGCFGVTLAPTWKYAKFNDDTRSLRAVVALLFSLVFACTILDGQILNFYLLKNYGGILSVDRIPKEFAVFVFLSVVVTFISDFFLVSRIWRLRRVHWSMIALAALTTFATLIGGAVLFNQLLNIPSVMTILTNGLFDGKKHKIAVSAVNLMAAASQALITFCLWYSFRAHMDEASTTPQPVFRRLGLMVVIRGTSLTLAQLLLVILYLARPNQLWWFIIHQALPPLYYTTAISTLNIRLDLQAQPKTDEESRNDRASDAGIDVQVPTPAGIDPFMDYINRVPRPDPALGVQPVVAKSGGVGGFRTGQGADTKEIRLEWTPPQDELETSPPAIRNSSHLPPALTPNRLNQDINLSSVFAPSKEGESTVCVAEKGTDAYYRPRTVQQFLGIFKSRGGG
ncbi:hypothetical protein PQX77_017354 [Marasmius sp. AFHP31]|nr:hypothetical protein PQX77_017354 [Marasmius sp. AFHP31]